MIGSRTSVGGCEKIPDASVSKIQVFEREWCAFVWGAREREREAEDGEFMRLNEREKERERKKEWQSVY